MNWQRRHFLKAALGTAVLPSFAQSQAKIAEDDPKNTKIAHRLVAKNITDDDLHFLQQIGLRWARLEFGEGDISLDALAAEQKRYARYGMKIFSGVHYAYRSTKVQLGQPGRDEMIEMYCRFLRN